MADFAELKKKLAAAGQSAVLRFWDELSAPERERFAAELEGIDWAALPGLIRDYVLKRPEMTIPADLEPAPFFPLVPRDEAQKAYYEKARRHGEEMLKAGRISCLTVAGGQGTRLGFDGPKGTYPIGPVTGRSLFAYFAGTIRRLGEKYGRPVTWYVMTSLLNREATEAFFQKNGYFGLAPEQLFFFTQGTMPAIGRDGQLLLAGKSALSLSPDGHGGTLMALRRSGALDRMKREGADTLFYFQVDNPLAPIGDPLFAGLHDLEKSDMSAIMLSKTNPYEKLGNFCVTGGRLTIIEYSDLPAELAESRSADGSLRFVAGSPAIHVISRGFVEKLTAGGSLRLPWHRADKKIACLDEAGHPVTPEEPNGVKLETFIFDALPLAERTMVLEGDRASVFAPTKNKTGVDSAESCRAMLTDRDGRRLERCGVAVPRNADGSPAVRLEFSPAVILDDADLAAYLARNPVTLKPGDTLVIE